MLKNNMKLYSEIQKNMSQWKAKMYGVNVLPNEKQVKLYAMLKNMTTEEERVGR